MSTYAWIIDTDHLAEPGTEPGTIATNAATVTGPSDAPADLLARLADGAGRPFRILDSDEELYYSGRIVGVAEDDAIFMGSPDTDESADFGPLWDFGTPNAGASDLQYRNAAGAWQSI